MSYLIRTKDGRTTVGTAEPGSAADHVEKLRQLGAEVDVVDFNGKRFEITSLRRDDELMKAVVNAIRQRSAGNAPLPLGTG